ncbi:MAG: hypothetical protein ACRC2S_27725 [Waterburya sp.]
MSTVIEKALQLKHRLVDFVYDAEGQLAIALETYAAEHSQKNSYGIKQKNLTIDSFITAGQVEAQTPLSIFLEQATDLNKSDRDILESWHNNFLGLFEIKEIKDDYYQLFNWLTAKEYQVYGHSELPAKEVSRWQPGEIIVTIIAPFNNNDWFFFSDRIIKGKLSQPKLAVAIGEFRDNYPDFLYADAPDLLEEAWESVAVYDQEFIDYFGSDHLTLPGDKLNQEISKLQQIMSKKRLAEAGIDDSKSLSDMLAESGTSEAEFAETATDLGVDAEAVTNIIQNKNKLSMVTPKVDLPPEIKEAKSVTVFSHPRWGQMFLPNFQKFTDLLANQTQENSNLLIRKYLEKPEANYYVWQQIKQQYPSTLEKLLKNYCNQDNFNLDTDLDQLLLKYNKSATPKLPAIASVPIHINNLLEAAIAQVQKTKAKTKKKKKKGFLSS